MKDLTSVGSFIYKEKGFPMNLNEGWFSSYDWHSADDVREGLKTEISSDYEFVNNFGNFFCFIRKKDKYPVCEYYLIKPMGGEWGYKGMSAQYSGKYNAQAAKWLKDALIEYGSTKEDPKGFEGQWEWIENGKNLGKERKEKRDTIKSLLKPGTKIKWDNDIVVFDKEYTNIKFVGHLVGNPRQYAFKYSDIKPEDIIVDKIEEAKKLLESAGFYVFKKKLLK